MTSETETLTLIKEKDYGTPAVHAVNNKTVTLEIDGREVTVPEGTSIMRAAADLGIMVPKLCATDNLDPFGSCRLCLVEIEGRKGTPASCTTPVAPGIKVTTQNDRLARIRKGVMELYISDHPLDCLTCAANGDCELQDMAGAVGLRDVRYGYDGANHVFARQHGEENPLWQTKDKSNPYFQFEPSKCIVCSRCVRACQEVQGTFALTIDGRGFASHVAASMDEDFLDSECVSCGACVQACPTATLIEKSIVDHGQPEHSVVTTCAYCGVGCSFKAEMQGERVVRMMPYKDGGANEGHSLRQGPLRLRLRYAQGPRLESDDPREDHRPLAGRLLGRGHQVRGRPLQGHAEEVRPRLHRRHHVFAHDQRGSLRRAAHGARRLRQQQCRHLRPRLPLADRLRPEADVRRIRRHAGLQERRQVRRHHGHRRQPDRRPPGVRLAHEEAPARRGQAHRRRSAAHRSGQEPARQGRLPPAIEAEHQRRRAQRALSRGRGREPDRPQLRRGALRERRLRPLGEVHQGPEEFARSAGSRSPACPRPTCAPPPACSPPAATRRSTTASASPSTARARPRSWPWPTSPWRPATSATRASA